LARFFAAFSMPLVGFERKSEQLFSRTEGNSGIALHWNAH